MLDAPELQDDFYLNLVDWSSQNVLSVGLGTCVYLWSAYTSQVSVSLAVLNTAINPSIWLLCEVYAVMPEIILFDVNIHNGMKLLGLKALYRTFQ